MRAGFEVGCVRGDGCVRAEADGHATDGLALISAAPRSIPVNHAPFPGSGWGGVEGGEKKLKETKERYCRACRDEAPVAMAAHAQEAREH